MKLQDLVFTDGLAVIRAQEFLLCITANGDMTYTIKKYSNNKTDVIVELASASVVQDTLDYYFPEPTQSHQTEPKAHEKGLNLSQSAQSTQVGGDHYSKLAIQPMRYSMVNGLDPLQHTIIKYVTRFRDKGGLQDLEKAKHCIDMLIEHEQAIDEMAFKHTLDDTTE